MFTRILTIAAFAATMFVTASQAASLKTLWEFSCGAKDGCLPSGTGLTTDVTGALYGATAYGGSAWGVAFELHAQPDHPRWKLDTIGTFSVNRPRSGLIPTNVVQGAFGVYYGTTAGGGKFGYGTIFQLVPPNEGETRWTENVIYNFCLKFACRDGSAPLDGLVADSGGALYGVTRYGGTDDGGVLFVLRPPQDFGGQWSYSEIHSFCSKRNCTDGRLPSGRLSIDQFGNIYGTTQYGGPNDAGIAYEINDFVFRKIYTFCSKRNCKDGRLPAAGLLPSNDAFGNIYGTTSSGGAFGSGTVFKLTFNGEVDMWSETVLYSFCSEQQCSDGQTPGSSVIFDQAGNMFGTTAAGGASGNGTVYRMSPIGQTGNWTHSVVYSFCSQADCRDGKAPMTELLREGAILYGTTLAGGFYGWGTVFQLRP